MPYLTSYSTLTKKLFTFLAFTLLFTTGVLSAPTWKALIVDGQNNHDWKATTPVLQEILEECGLFQVDVATTPAKGKAMDSFQPDFDRYDVIVLNYNGDNWPASTNQSFVEYVERGGGVVVFHAADNAFPRWKEFNEIIGLGGWGGRNETAGPMIRWRNGKMVRDESPGRGGSHGPQREYAVVTRDARHPIMQGLPAEWMHAKDELYARLRGPAKHVHILATSESKLTHEHEPILFTIQYGKGRIFHTVMGHGPYAMGCAGFAFTLQRGAEWAATGKVTLKKVPENFPTESKVAFRLRPVSIDQLISYEYGRDRSAWSMVQENIRNAAPGQRKEIEGLMLDVLDDSNSTFYARQSACRMLRRIGTAKSVPALAKLLADEKLSHISRFALQGIDSSRVDSALRKALKQLEGDLRIGVIGTIAQRGDTKAVPAIAKWMGSDDPKLAHASIKALGQIGGPRAVKALEKAQVSPALDDLRNDSLLLCADRFAQSKKRAQAKALYKKMTDTRFPARIRLAAYRGLIQTDPKQAVSTLISLLKDEDAVLRQAAAGPLFALVPGAETSRAVMDAASSMQDDTKILVLGAVAARGDKTVAPQVVQVLNNGSVEVQKAALQALSILGSAEHVQLLAVRASQEGTLSSTAQECLNRLQGTEVDRRIVELIQQGDQEIQPVLIKSLIARRSEGAIRILLEKALASNAAVRKESIHGLKAIATQDDIPAMLRLIAKLKRSNEIRGVEEAVLQVARQMENAGRRTDYFLNALSGAPENLRRSIMNLLGEFGGERAGRVVVNAVKNDSSPQVRDAAYRALASWPDASPIDTLFSLFHENSDSNQRQQALKGYLRMIDLVQNEPMNQTIQRYQAAMNATSNKDEKELVIKAVSYRANSLVLDFLEPYLDKKEIGTMALDAYKRVVKSLEKSDSDRNTWKVSASHNSRNAKNAIDGKRNTRWDTGTPQKPGMWYQIDLGSERVIEEITLDTRGSNGDYPRGFEIYCSFNSNTWGQPVIKGKGTGPVTVIAIPSKSARFIRIVQTGSVDGLFWSIHELNIKVSSSKEKLEHAYEVLKKYEK